jgi:hypothetical protein
LYRSATILCPLSQFRHPSFAIPSCRCWSLNAIFITEHIMAYVGMPESSVEVQDLAVLERGYLRDLQDVAAARASCASLREVADHDEQEIRRELARIESLLRQMAPSHAVQRSEEVAYA